MSNLSNNDNQDFLHFVEEAEKQHSSSPYFEAAKVLYAANKITDSIQLTKKALKIFPEHPGALTLMAKLLWEKGDFVDSESFYKQVLSADEKYSEALLGYAEFLLDQERAVESLDYFRKYIEAGNWDDTSNLNTMISLADDLGKMSDILPTLKLIWQKSLSPQLGFRYAYQLRMRERFDDAVDLLKLLTSGNQEPAFFNELGLCLVKQGKLQEAAEAFTKAISSKCERSEMESKDNQDDLQIPHFGIYWCNLAYCYTQLHNEEQARKAIDKAFALDKTSTYPWGRKVEFFLKFEHYKKSFETAKKAIDFFSREMPGSSSDLSGFYRMGIEALVSLGKNIEAQAFIEMAREKYPDNKLFYFASIDNLMDQKKYKEALALFEFESNYSYDKDEYVALVRRHILISLKVGREAEIPMILAEFVKNNGEKEFLYLEYEIWVGSDDINGEEESRLMDLVRIEIEKLAPGFCWFTMLNANQAINGKNFDLARSFLEGINLELVKNDEKAHIYNGLGYMWMLDGKFDKAKECFQKVLELDLDELEYIGPELAFICFYQNGNWKEKAARGVRRLVKSAARINLTSIALAHGEFDQATKYTYQLIDQQTENERKLGMGFELMGFISAAKNEPLAAEAAWRLAIDAGADKEDMESNILQPSSPSNEL